MRKALRLEWSRVALSIGNIRYVAKLSDHLTLNVWRSGSYWRYVVVGWPVGITDEWNDALIFQSGGAPTMGEAKLRAENQLEMRGLIPQQTLFDKETPNDLPF